MFSCKREAYPRGTESGIPTIEKSKGLHIVFNKDKFKWNDPNRMPETRPQTWFKETLDNGDSDLSYDNDSCESECEVIDNPYANEAGWYDTWKQERNDRERRTRWLEEERDVADSQDEEEELMWVSIHWSSYLDEDE